MTLKRVAMISVAKKRLKGHSQSKNNPKVKYTCSTGHDDIKGNLPENAQKFIDFDDCRIVSDNDAMDLKSISWPPKLKKKGSTSAIGGGNWLFETILYLLFDPQSN